MGMPSCNRDSSSPSNITLASCPLFFQGLKPVVDIATAVHIAHQIWGLRVADDDDPPRPLESYDDCNFYMVCL